METDILYDDDNERLKSAKKRFEMYGRQNDHISHIPHESILRPISRDNHSDLESNHVQHTLMLQENGKLAHYFDEVDYLVEGLLSNPNHRSMHAIEHAQNVLELIRMLRDVRVQKMLEISDSLEHSSRECKIGYRLRAVVNLLSDPDMNAHRFFQVCIAALAYQMSVCESFSEIVDDQMVKLMIKQLQQGRKEGVRGLLADRNVSTQCIQSYGHAKKKRSFLKRKTSCNDGRSEAVIYQGLDNIFGSEEFLSFSKASNTSFDNIALSTLYNLLDHECFKQTNEPSTHSCAEPSMNAKYNQQHIVLAALRTTQTRRRILVQCDGIATLTELLEIRYHLLKNACFSELRNLNDTESTSYLHDVRVVLRVLYQASFLCVSVQQSMVQEEGMLAVLLELVQYLSEACFAPEAMPKKESNTPIDLASDVLLATLRVIINLTHNNDAAAIQIGRLQGIQILFHAFCRMWHLVAHDDNIEMDEKVIYDGFLLLLSAMTNITEYNARNRDIVMGIPKSFSGLQLLGAPNVCNVVVSFFMNKISSYVEYIEATDGQEDSASDIIEESSRLFVPEDVILGGCASLFLGCLMKGRPENASMILRCLPNQSSKLPLRALSAFVALHSQIGTLTAEVGKSVLEVEKVFKLYSDLGQVSTQQNLTPNKQNSDYNDENTFPTPECSQDRQHAWLSSKSRTRPELKSSVLEQESRFASENRKKNLCGSLSDDSDCDASQTGPDTCQIKKLTSSTSKGSRSTPKTPLISRKKLTSSSKSRAKRAKFGTTLRNLGEDFDSCV